jgi:hypothetical protein
VRRARSAHTKCDRTQSRRRRLILSAVTYIQLFATYLYIYVTCYIWTVALDVGGGAPRTYRVCIKRVSNKTCLDTVSRVVSRVVSRKSRYMYSYGTLRYTTIHVRSTWGKATPIHGGKGSIPANNGIDWRQCRGEGCDACTCICEQGFELTCCP